MQPELPIQESTAGPADLSTWPRVTFILEATGIADYSKIPNAEFYLQRGSDVHMAAADVDHEIPDYWTGTDLEGYVNAWIKFKEETKFKAELIEHSVFNETRRYRGTLDRVGKFGDGRDRVLIDIKSGIAAEWVRLQTAAYAACLDRPETILRYGLQLKKDGTYKLSEPYKDYRQDSNVFFCLVSTLHGRTLYGKTEIMEGE
jgi:hypothetical protein